MKKILSSSIVIAMCTFIFFPILWNSIQCRKNIMHYPLKCKAFSKVEVDTDEGKLSFFLNESIQFFKLNEGLIQFEGYIINGATKTYIERSVYMTQIATSDSSNFLFSKIRITKSAVDTTPDKEFDQLWSEISSSDELINISVDSIKPETITVINSFSPQFTCVVY